jgi:GNAT superfamily N-acetyltransferase
MSVVAGQPEAFESGPEDPGRGVGLPPGVILARVSPDRRLDAAVRLVGDQTDDPYTGARRFLETADGLQIDLSFMWATQGPDGSIRQVSLAVPGSGRTVMLFVSGPARRRRGSPAPLSDLGAGPGPTRERVAVLRAACQWASHDDGSGGACALAQSLLEPRETEAIAAFTAAGFTKLGELAYLRRVGIAPAPSQVHWPDNVTLECVAGLMARGQTDAHIADLLKRALTESYIDTQDCPELCGLRSVDDVLASHRAVGRYDPSLWWIVRLDGRAEGCLLFNVCPEHESVELVYLGLSPALRGKGLGSILLNMGLRRVLGAARPEESGGQPGEPSRCVVGPGGVTCAVDTRNAPAMRLYRAAGFQRFAVRVPMVLGLRS